MCLFHMRFVFGFRNAEIQGATKFVGDGYLAIVCLSFVPRTFDFIGNIVLGATESVDDGVLAYVEVTLE